MNALISPDEIVITIDETVGWRIAQVAEKEFPVAEPLFWIECADNVTADGYYFDKDSGIILPKPLSPEEQQALIIEV